VSRQQHKQIQWGSADFSCLAAWVLLGAWEKFIKFLIVLVLIAFVAIKKEGVRQGSAAAAAK